MVGERTELHSKGMSKVLRISVSVGRDEETKETRRRSFDGDPEYIGRTYEGAYEGEREERRRKQSEGASVLSEKLVGS